jgi:hypothetical protein
LLRCGRSPGLRLMGGYGATPRLAMLRGARGCRRGLVAAFGGSTGFRGLRRAGRRRPLRRAVALSLPKTWTPVRHGAPAVVVVPWHRWGLSRLPMRSAKLGVVSGSSVPLLLRRRQRGRRCWATPCLCLASLPSAARARHSRTASAWDGTVFTLARFCAYQRLRSWRCCASSCWRSLSERGPRALAAFSSCLSASPMGGCGRLASCPRSCVCGRGFGWS